MNKPDKGKKNGSCNRTACQAQGADWYNTSTQEFYCESCARLINDACKRFNEEIICFAPEGYKDPIQLFVEAMEEE